MTKCTTALGIVPGNSILLYMRVPAAKSDLRILKLSSMLHFFSCFLFCRVGFGGVNYFICSTCLKPIAPFLYALFTRPQCFWSGRYYAGAHVYSVGQPKAMSCWCEGQAGLWVSGILSMSVSCDGEIWCNLRLQSMICNTWLITPLSNKPLS